MYQTGGNGIPHIPYIKIIGGLLCGAYLLYNGVQMIFLDIRSSELTSLKLFGSELSATSLEIVVIFIGAVIVVLTITWRLTENGSRGQSTRTEDSRMRNY
jgi:hypothetical protein